MAYCLGPRHVILFKILQVVSMPLAEPLFFCSIFILCF